MRNKIQDMSDVLIRYYELLENFAHYFLIDLLGSHKRLIMCLPIGTLPRYMCVWNTTILVLLFVSVLMLHIGKCIRIILLGSTGRCCFCCCSCSCKGLSFFKLVLFPFMGFVLCELFGILHCSFFGSAGVFNMSNISTKGTNRLCLPIKN
jgi:hypothetical protein